MSSQNPPNAFDAGNTSPEVDLSVGAILGEIILDEANDALTLKPDHEEERVFTLFPTLPLELREKIWESYDQQPRVINIYNYINTREASGALMDDIERLMIRYRGIPLLLSVNRESRRAILRSYMVLRKGTGMFLNLASDFFYFHNWESYKTFTELLEKESDASDAGSFQSKVLTIADMEANLKHFAIGYWNVYSAKLHGMANFKSLETISVCSASKKWHWSPTANAWDTMGEREERWLKEWREDQLENGNGLPQVILEKGDIISMNGEERYWLEQLADGKWEWFHQPHDEGARHEGWGPEEDSRDL